MTAIISLAERRVARAERPRYPLAATLDVVAPHVPGALVAPPAWEAARGAAGWLPAALAGGFYLECRLREGEDRVDLIVRVDEAGRDVLAGRNAVVRLPGILAADPVWERVSAFCRAWAEAGPGPWSAVQHLWLELDLGGGAGERHSPLPTPSVFVGLHPERTRGVDDAGWNALLDLFAPFFLPGGLAPGARRELRRVVAARPAGAAVPYFGFMLSRPDAAVRVYLDSPGDVDPFLGSLGWPAGERAAVREWEDALRPAPRIGMIHVDVGAALLPRLGVEHTFERRGQPRGVLAEAAFLGRLADAGLASQAKRDALLAWPGHETRTLPHELWPSRVLRRLNCVKLLHHPGAPPEAKAYLFTHHPPA